jgi:hypothetical protein
MITIFDCEKRFVLIEKAPFLVIIDEDFIDRYSVDKYYMVRNLNRFDFENAQKRNSDVKKNDFYMIVDLGETNKPIQNIDYIGFIIDKNNTEKMNSYNKLK